MIGGIGERVRQPVPSKCTSPKADGSPCTRDPQPGKDVCWSHDDSEAIADQRRRNSSAGGKAVMSLVSEKATAQRQEIAGIKEQLRTLAAELKDGSVPPQTGGVVVQVYNALLRAVDLDRKVRELDDMDERLSALEGGEKA